MTEERTQLVVTVERYGGVLIGRDIEVQVVSADRGKARLAIRAPAAVRIHRTDELQHPVSATARPPTEPLSEMEETLRLVRAAASTL